MAEELLGKKFSGKTVYNGITMGKVLVLRKDQERIRRTRVENPEQEIERVQGMLMCQNSSLPCSMTR